MRKLRSTIAAALALIAAPAAGKAGEAEPPSYTDPLPTEPRDIVAAFLRDHTAWNAFAREHYDRTGDYTAPETAYRRLIDLYCGPQKSHQGIVFSSNARYDAQRSEILEEREEDGRRIVTIRHTGANEFVTVHHFAFVKSDGRWRLEELYYYDDYGDEWLPSL